MDQAAHSPFSPPPPRGSRQASPSIEASPAGTADLPSAVPEGDLARAHARQQLLEALRESVRRIERAPPLEAGPSAADSGWRLGAPDADRLLPSGLETDSLHEIKADASASGAIAGAWMAGLGFALRLAVRRIAQVSSQEVSRKAPWILWCWTRVLAQELGRPSYAGLRQLGLDPAHVLIAETARDAEALIALEEGLKSGSLALAIGVFKDIDLTPARRLSLAAAEQRTPCLAVTHPSSLPSAATATRWRVGWCPSAAHPFDSKAPGAARFSLRLERARQCPKSVTQSSLLLEWSDETHRFGMAASLADRAAPARRTEGRARG